MIKLKPSTYLKILAIIAGIIPLAWLSYQIIFDQLSADPAKDIQHFTGTVTINFLLVTLLLSPLAKLPRATILNSLRRTLGLTTFCWSILHVLSYFVFELAFDFSLFFSEIFQRTYLMIGLITWIGLFLLAITSNKFSIKKLKKNWKKLHNIVYPMAILASTHYYISLKAKNSTPFIYLTTFLVLWGIHLYFKYRKHKKSTQ